MKAVALACSGIRLLAPSTHASPDDPVGGCGAFNYTSKIQHRSACNTPNLHPRCGNRLHIIVKHSQLSNRYCIINADTMDPSEESSEGDTYLLLKWFKEHGGWLHPNVEILFNEEYGYHGVASGDIKAGTTLLECPIELSLSHLNLDPEQNLVPYYRGKVTKCVGRLPPEQLTRLLLIEQLVLGEKSPWAWYIFLLPDPHDLTSALWFDSPFWNNTPLEWAREDRLGMIQAEWDHIKKVLEEVGLKNSELYHECDL